MNLCLTCRRRFVVGVDDVGLAGDDRPCDVVSPGARRTHGRHDLRGGGALLRLDRRLQLCAWW